MHQVKVDAQWLIEEGSPEARGTEPRERSGLDGSEGTAAAGRAGLLALGHDYCWWWLPHMHTPGPPVAATTASAHHVHAEVRGCRLGLLQHGSSGQHKTLIAQLAVVLLKRCSIGVSKLCC